MPSTPQPQRVVAIVGRPNVGKSAIFNRIANRRVAIVHAESGVTRDRLIREVSWQDQRFDLIDTGGLGNVDATGTSAIEAGVRTQVEAALDDATVALLVVDIETGLHPLDAGVATLLRKRNCRTFVVANKADNEGREAGADDFASLNFPIFAVSALHDRGFGPLLDAVLAALPPGENRSTTKPLRVAVVGRPNVGKSSYINRLLHSDRVIVSPIPGTTRDSIDIPFTVGSGPQARHYLLIDTAGMRHVGKIDSAVERFSHFRAERTVREADVIVLMLSAEDGPTAHDKKIAALIQEHGKGCLMLMNKWDTQHLRLHDAEKAARQSIPFMKHCPLLFISAKTGHNVRRSIETIDLVAAQVSSTLPTGILNRVVLDACQRVHPPMVDGRRLKIYYATQSGVEPVRIRLFVNHPHRLVPAYREYLLRSIRTRFGLEGAPVILDLRSHHGKEGKDGKQAGPPADEAEERREDRVAPRGSRDRQGARGTRGRG